jgi:hypothetical protein
LGSWISTIQTQLKVHQVSPASSCLSNEQALALALKQLGFCMIPTRYKQLPGQTKQVWNETRYLELQASHEKHGHARVRS